MKTILQFDDSEEDRARSTFQYSRILEALTNFQNKLIYAMRDTSLSPEQTRSVKTIHELFKNEMKQCGFDNG